MCETHTGTRTPKRGRTKQSPKLQNITAGFYKLLGSSLLERMQHRPQSIASETASAATNIIRISHLTSRWRLEAAQKNDGWHLFFLLGYDYWNEVGKDSDGSRAVDIPAAGVSRHLPVLNS